MARHWFMLLRDSYILLPQHLAKHSIYSARMKINKYVSCFFLLFSISSITTAERNFGYQWKPYDREIPFDAFVAGYDNYKPVYIGQASVQSDLIPGRLDEDDYQVYYVREEQVESANKDLKILCYSQRGLLRSQWRPTSTETLSRSSKMFLVNGGHEQDMNIYIGRVQNGEETAVGKVMCNDSYCSPLYPIRDGVQVQHYTFEVLEPSPVLTAFPRF